MRNFFLSGVFSFFQVAKIYKIAWFSGHGQNLILTVIPNRWVEGKDEKNEEGYPPIQKEQVTEANMVEAVDAGDSGGSVINDAEQWRGWVCGG